MAVMGLNSHPDNWRGFGAISDILLTLVFSVLALLGSFLETAQNPCWVSGWF